MNPVGNESFLKSHGRQTTSLRVTCHKTIFSNCCNIYILKYYQESVLYFELSETKLVSEVAGPRNHPDFFFSLVEGTVADIIISLCSSFSVCLPLLNQLDELC